MKKAKAKSAVQDENATDPLRRPGGLELDYHMAVPLAAAEAADPLHRLGLNEIGIQT